MSLHSGTSRRSPGIAVFLQGCLLLTMSALASVASAEGLPSFESTYSEWVDAKGKITLPDDFQTQWVFLGAWSIAEKDAQPGAAGLHNVYTQPGVVEYFREHQSFPDGAVIIKELLKAETSTMTTGTVSRATKYEGWFVMVKDTQGRFKDNPLWGDGWGWSLFNVDSDDAVTKDYRAECLGCHIPAQKADWIYTEGYPLLRPEND